eukprot:XP_002936851.1 PREDICTED: polycomb group RING finger protein 6 isoform X1 [Xenopus tropicalis]
MECKNGGSAPSEEEEMEGTAPPSAASAPEAMRSSFGENEGMSGEEEEGEEDDEGIGEQPSGGEAEEHMINLTDLNPYILCSICKGYLIDATTITECLHTFCKSCIVKHFYYTNRCPKCNIVVHQTQPLYNIRLDRQLQDIVFKLVVDLEQREKNQMYAFYKERGLDVPKHNVPQPISSSRAKQKKTIEPVFRIPPELDVSLLLEFMGAEKGTGSFKPLEKKYVRVSGEATIGHVEKFLRRKMELNTTCQVDIICGDHLLEHFQTLKEILSAIGEKAIQDGLLVLHFVLVLSPLSLT